MNNYINYGDILNSMLGFMHSNNDIYVYLEKNELEQLESKPVVGIYFNLKDLKVTGKLEAVIDSSINEKIKTEIKRETTGFISYMKLIIRTQEYERLREEHSVEPHDGYRHIRVVDASDVENLSFTDENIYAQLKFYEAKIGK
ncbi:MAG: hypothetical protein ACP5N3_05415 [Candidatus Nanoarchaeia archaeon]